MDRKEAIEYAKFRLECHTKGDGEYTDYGEFLVAAIEALQEPQVGDIEINKDFETILLCAVRYAIGRKSYMPSMVIDYITPLLPYLSYWMLGLMAAEIIDHNYEGGLGDEKIDKPSWLEFLRKIRLEMGGRNEP